MRPVSRPISTAKAAARKDDKARQTRQTILALAAASALALCSLAAAQADTWVTANPDGSVTRTVTSATAPAHNYDGDNDYTVTYPPVVAQTQPNVQLSTGNTTFFSGTYYPVPTYRVPAYPAGNLYPYYNPGGVTYPIGPQVPGFHSPTITTLPSTGYAYGYPGYVHPGYGYPAYPAPVYSYPYPLYGSTGVYYSGPAGGGGTIYSSTATTNSGISGRIGNKGWNLNIGNRKRETTSTTTVTTSR